MTTTFHLTYFPSFLASLAFFICLILSHIHTKKCSLLRKTTIIEGREKNILKTKTSPTRSVVHFFVEQYKTKTIQYNVHRFFKLRCYEDKNETLTFCKVNHSIKRQLPLTLMILLSIVIRLRHIFHGNDAIKHFCFLFFYFHPFLTKIERGVVVVVKRFTKVIFKSS